MKVLFDTNVFISEALVGGLAERIIRITINARGRIFVSSYLLDEVQRVLVEKLEFGTRLAGAVRQRIRRRCESVNPIPSRHHVIDDPKDSPILQAAVSAGVDFLVSDDRHLLRLNPYEGIRILSMREFESVLKLEGLLPGE